MALRPGGRPPGDSAWLCTDILRDLRSLTELPVPQLYNGNKCDLPHRHAARVNLSMSVMHLKSPERRALETGRPLLIIILIMSHLQSLLPAENGAAVPREPWAHPFHSELPPQTKYHYPWSRGELWTGASGCMVPRWAGLRLELVLDCLQFSGSKPSAQQVSSTQIKEPNFV